MSHVDDRIQRIRQRFIDRHERAYELYNHYERERRSLSPSIPKNARAYRETCIYYKQNTQDEIMVAMEEALRILNEEK